MKAPGTFCLICLGVTLAVLVTEWDHYTGMSDSDDDGGHIIDEYGLEEATALLPSRDWLLGVERPTAYDEVFPFYHYYHYPARRHVLQAGCSFPFYTPQNIGPGWRGPVQILSLVPTVDWVLLGVQQVVELWQPLIVPGTHLSAALA